MADININGPVNNKALEDAMMQTKANDCKETQNNMFQMLVKAELMIPVKLDKKPVKHSDQTMTVAKGTRIDFPMIKSVGGNAFTMGFTSEAELLKWSGGKRVNHAVFCFDDYAQLILQEDSNLSGLVINPFHQNVVFPKSLIETLQQHKAMLLRKRAV